MKVIKSAPVGELISMYQSALADQVHQLLTELEVARAAIEVE